MTFTTSTTLFNPITHYNKNKIRLIKWSHLVGHQAFYWPVFSLLAPVSIHMKQLWLYDLQRCCGIKVLIIRISIEKSEEDLWYLLHQGKVRVCQRLWLANLENHVLEDQDDGKHGDDDNYNEDDEDDEDEDCVSHLEVWFCDRCWKISPSGELTGPSGQAGVAPSNKVWFFLSYIVFLRWPTLRCSFVSYLCISLFNIFAISRIIISSTIMNDYMIMMNDRSRS